MMRRTTGTTAGVHVGSATLVMLFAVLCLTIFAALSVITARNGWTLAEKSADAVTAYYAADSQAIQIFDQLTSAYDGTLVPPETVPAQLEEVDGALRLSYWVTIDENQQLWVQLSQTQEGLQIVRWQVERTETWNADQTISVWGG